MRKTTGLLLFPFFLACSSRGPLVVVTVEATPSISGVAHVHATVNAIGASRDFDFSPTTPTNTPFTFGIDLPSDASGAISVHVILTGGEQLGGVQLGAGDGSGNINPGGTANVTVTIGGVALDGGADAGGDLAPVDMTRVCTPGATGCRGNTLQVCDPSGVWTDSMPCNSETPTCSAGACGLPPSCVGLAGCGPTNQTTTCCRSVLVPGGAYNRSNDATYPAMVSDFRLDAYEVNVGRFRQFVGAGMGTQASPPAAGSGAHASPMIANTGWSSLWDSALATDTTALEAALACDATATPPHYTWTNTASGAEGMPINCVTWYEAFAFCAWDGGWLPSEAEWNYAAAGGAEQRVYPWSVPPAGMTITSMYASYALGGATPNALYAVGTAPLGNGKWTHSDLAGNVFEWVLDSWESPYASGPCSDCAYLAVAPERVIRGGAFNYDKTLLYTYLRTKTALATRNSSVGIRCARAP